MMKKKVLGESVHLKDYQLKLISTSAFYFKIKINNTNKQCYLLKSNNIQEKK